MFKSIKTGNISKEIVKQFIDSIKNNELKAGDRLPPELELVKIFKVSRGTIREALKNLEVLGLITIKTGSGTFIKDIDAGNMLKTAISQIPVGKKELLDLIEIRKILETYGLSKAIENADEKDLKLIKNELIKMEKNINDDTNKFVENDINFHLLILKSTKNEILVKMVEAIRISLRAQQLGAVGTSGLLKRSLNYHKKIFNALEKRDFELAKEEISDHLKDVEKIIKKS